MEEHLEGLKPLRELAKNSVFLLDLEQIKSNSKNFVKICYVSRFNKIHLDSIFYEEEIQAYDSVLN
jgi:hypothetical protein